MATTKFGFDKMQRNFESLKRDLPVTLGNTGERFFRESFDKQEFVDEVPKKWDNVQRRIPGTPEYKYPKTKQLSRRTSAILVRTGKLRQAVNNSLKRATFQEIVFEVPLKYAPVHNYGLVMKNGSPMPERKFMGHSAVLIRKLGDKIAEALKKLRR
jgi:phage gpG-like protein